MPEPAIPKPDSLAETAHVAGTRPHIQPNAKHEYQVTQVDVPLSCPMPEMYLWNSHPRVYLAIEETGWAKCSYCGAEYTLTDWKAEDAYL